MSTPTPLPVSFTASPLPLNFNGTPQQLCDAFTARLTLTTETQLSLFVAGSIAPVTNSGPWLNNGVTWYVWDVATGAYIPEILTSQSLQYIAQQQPPDPTIYTFWIALDANGNPINIQYYSNSQWEDIYGAQIQSLLSSLASTTYISYPTSAFNSGTQILTIDGTFYQIQYNSVLNDPYALFNTSTYTYTAPVTGLYWATGRCQIDNINGSGSGEFRINLAVNGSSLPYSCNGGTNGFQPPGMRWYPAFSGMFHANAGDAITVVIWGNDSDAYYPVDFGTVLLSSGYFDVFLIRPDVQQPPPALATGTFTLISGAKVVANTAITVNSVIDFTVYSASGTISQQPYVVSKTAGVGFTVHAGSGDNSTYNYSFSQ